MAEVVPSFQGFRAFSGKSTILSTHKRKKLPPLCACYRFDVYDDRFVLLSLYRIRLKPNVPEVLCLLPIAHVLLSFAKNETTGQPLRSNICHRALVRNRCLHVCMCLCLYMREYDRHLCIYTCVHICILNIYTCTHTYAHTRMHTHTYAYIFTDPLPRLWNRAKKTHRRTWPCVEPN